MSYATLPDVQSFIPKWRIGADTQPASTEVVKYLDRLSARLDGICAAQGYAIPVSGAQSLDLLKSICLVGAGWYVGRVTFPNGGVEAVDDYRREFEQMILELTEGKLILPDAASNSAIEIETVLTSSATAASSMVPFFTRSMTF